MHDQASIPARPLFFGSEIFRHSSYGPKHPLAIPRVSTTIDLCRALGWLPDAVYVDSPVATPTALARFHKPAYIAALAEAEKTQRLPPADRVRFNLGRLENPIFGEMFRRPATAAGASLLAAERLLAARAGGRDAVIYNPAGGTHPAGVQRHRAGCARRGRRRAARPGLHPGRRGHPMRRRRPGR